MKPRLWLWGVVLLQLSSSAIASESWVPERGPSDPLLGHGAVVWATTFGSDGPDWINRVIPLRSSDFLAVGYLGPPDSEGDFDAVAHRFTAEGDTVWTRRLGGEDFDALWSAVEFDDGRLALAGFSARGGVATDQWLVLLSADGTTVLETHFDAGGAERATDLVPARDGLLLVGQTSEIGGAEPDIFLVRTDREGRERWRRTIGGDLAQRGFYGVQTEGDGFVIAGVTGRRNAYDLLVVKIDAQGDEVWRQVVGGDGNDPNHGIHRLSDGRIVVVGYTQSWGAVAHDLVAVILSSSGRILSHQTLGTPGDDRVMNSIPTRDGGSWLVGATRDHDSEDWDILLARLTPNGTFEPWIVRLGTPLPDWGTTLAEAGELLVLGGHLETRPGGSAADLLLATLDPALFVRHSATVKAIPTSAGPAHPTADDLGGAWLHRVPRE